MHGAKLKNLERQNEHNNSGLQEGFFFNIKDCVINRD
jgi:hypothetical protein